MEMTRHYDLHTHSTESDGTLTPAQLVERAVSAGVDVLALTDHDTTSGVAEARRAAQPFSIEVWSGVEVSVSWGGVAVHLVGLCIDPDNEALNAGLAELRDFRHWRAREIGRSLEKRGIEGAYEGARALASGSLISRTHFARFLVNQGVVAKERKVYQKYLTPGKPGYVTGQWATLEEAVGWVRGAGGKAVIAHPARYRMTRSRLRRLIREFVDAGGEGLEVVSGSHSLDESLAMGRLAVEFGLVGSVGSDYHGPEQPWVDLGRPLTIPPGVRPIWLGFPP